MAAKWDLGPMNRIRLTCRLIRPTQQPVQNDATFSNGSCVPSGSVAVFQFEVPADRSAVFTADGVAVGCVDLYSAEIGRAHV